MRPVRTGFFAMLIKLPTVDGATRRHVAATVSSNSVVTAGALIIGCVTNKMLYYTCMNITCAAGVVVGEARQSGQPSVSVTGGRRQAALLERYA